MANYSYQGTSHPFVANSGIVLCSIGPVPVGTGTGQNSTQRNGVAFQYQGTKQDAIDTDHIPVLYLGRSKPAVETSGQVRFEVYTLSYAWPPGATALDGSTDPYLALLGIIDDTRSGYLVQMQIPEQYGPAYNGIPYAAYYGILQDVRIDLAPQGMPGWSTWSATFTEVG